MGAERIHELTPRERDCLRLVRRDRSSKQIAITLGISHHTVDARLKKAIQLLEVTSRYEAARLLAEFEADTETPYQPLVSQPQPVAVTPISDEQMLPERNEPQPQFRVPFLRQGRRVNDLAPLQRLLWIGALSLLILVAFANFTNALDVLQTMTKGLVR
ncbi:MULTISPECIES: helix-turn-helix domain-containing protein [Sphingomonas]|jgi:DNA-binding CsgD family transcriptional regulator|uniref:helix-turn-helix domain-containing protein n=1 Tax=Sphingomonas TaxID=13687 RepID=UPI001AE61308